jgi:trehalose synthase
MALQQVEILALDPKRFEELLSDHYAEFARAVEEAQHVFDNRTVWNVNSTAKGGGVAEMLRSLLAYSRGAGVDARWAVIEGRPDFFRITKRIHNNLHGAAGDGGELGDAERKEYEEVAELNAAAFLEMVRPEDVVILHDPQTAGLAPHLVGKVDGLIWRCHVGLDNPNDIARHAWQFLLPYVEPAERYVFSREAFAWEGLDDDRIVVIAPSIDAFSPKNQDIDEERTLAILRAAGVLDATADAKPTFHRPDGSEGVVDSAAEITPEHPIPSGVPLVTQVSRWDRLKDPLGVIKGFVEYAAAREPGAHLAVAGPSVESVTDDPEGAEVFEEARSLWNELDAAMKERVHLLLLPMEDGDENAAIVNCLQRYSSIVVQKSLAEGFGLTVAEAMWKARPVVASRIGGIQDQIVDGESGVLLDDPTDLKAYGEAVADLLEDPARAKRMGADARERVLEGFLGPRHLMQYLDVIKQIVD